MLSSSAPAGAVVPAGSDASVLPVSVCSFDIVSFPASFPSLLPHPAAMPAAAIAAVMSSAPFLSDVYVLGVSYQLVYAD